MWLTILTNFLLPVAVKTVTKYIDSTESKNDDKVLELSKIGVEYLAKKGNNNVTKSIAKALKKTDMQQIQKSKLDL